MDYDITSTTDKVKRFKAGQMEVSAPFPDELLIDNQTKEMLDAVDANWAQGLARSCDLMFEDK